MKITSENVDQIQELRLIDPQEGRNPIVAIDLSASGHYFVTGHCMGHDDGVIRVWDTKSFSSRRANLEMPRNVNSVAISPDEKLVAVGHTLGSITLWDMESLQQLATLRGEPGPKNYVGGMDFSGELMATGDRYGKVRLWNRNTFEQITVWDDFSPSRLMFSPNEEFLVGTQYTYSEEKKVLLGIVRVWNPREQRFLFDLIYPDSTLPKIAFNPDGTLAVITAPHYTDGSTRALSVHFVNLTTGEQHLIFEDELEDRSMLGTVGFSPSGLLFAYATTKNLTVWDVQSRQKIAIIRGNYPIWQIAFNPDNETIISIGLGGPIQIWGIPAS